MIRRSLFLALLIASPPAYAQSVSEDLRCVFLANAFTKSGKDDAVKRAAAATGAFYLGRLEGRVSRKAVADAARASAASVTQKNASALMGACAARLARAEEALRSAAKRSGPTK